MSQQLSAKKLLKIANPFKDDIFNLGGVISKEKINQYITNIDFSVNENDKPIDIAMKNIAFLMMNDDNSTIVIDLGFPEEGKDSLDLIKEGKYTYVVSLLKEKEFINGYVIGSNTLAKKLLNTEVNEDFVIQKEKVLELVNFELDHYDNLNSWNNPKFCLEKLNIDFNTNFPLIAPELLTDNYFKLQVVMLGHDENIDSNLRYSIDVAKESIENIYDFINLWSNIYEEIFNITDIVKSLKKGSPIPYNYTLHELTLSENQIKVIDYLKENVLNNKDIIIKIMPSNKILNLYKYLSIDLQSDPDIIKHIFINEIKTDSYEKQLSYKEIPESFFDDVNNSIILINNFKKYYESHNESIVPFITKDKKYLEELLNNIKNQVSLDFLWKGNWKNSSLKRDKEIIEKFLEKDGKIYENLYMTEKRNMHFISLYLEKNGNIEYVPSDMYSKIDMELIKKSIMRYPDFLHQSIAPKEWQKNKDLLLCMGEKISWIGHSNKTWQKIIGDNEEDCINFIIINPKLYYALSKTMQRNHNVALTYLKNAKESLNPDFPFEIFASREFSIEALKHKIGLVAYIPKVMFTDKEFLKMLLLNIDDNKINYKVLDKSPNLKKILDAFDINNNYSQFFINQILKKDLNEKEAPVIKKLKI